MSAPRPSRVPESVWDAPIPAPRPRYLSVLSIRGRQQVVVYPRAPRATPVLIHWTGLRSVPCWRRPDCPYCQAELTRRYLAYLPANVDQLVAAHLVPLPPELVRAVPWLVTPPPELVGLRLVLRRAGLSIRSPLLLVQSGPDHRERVKGLPVIDTRAALELLWGELPGELVNPTAIPRQAVRPGVFPPEADLPSL